MSEQNKRKEFNDYKRVHDFMYPEDPIKTWVNGDNYTNLFKEDWDELMEVVGRIENLGYEFHIVGSRCKIVAVSDTTAVAVVGFDTAETKKEAIYKAVLDLLTLLKKEGTPLPNLRVAVLYEKALELLKSHINNGGELDYSEKEYEWLVETIEEVEVGYFGQDADSDFQKELEEEDFKMSNMEAIIALECRIKAVTT